MQPHYKGEAAANILFSGLFHLVTCSNPPAWDKGCVSGQYFIKTNVCCLIFRDWEKQMVERNLIHSLCALLWRWFCGSSQWWWNMYIVVVWKILFIVIVEGIWITEYAAYNLNIAFKNKVKHSNANCRRIFSWVQKARTELNFGLFAWMCCLWRRRFFSQRDGLDELRMHFCLRLLCFLSLYWRKVVFREMLIPFCRWIGWGIHRTELPDKGVPGLGATCSFW